MLNNSTPAHPRHHDSIIREGSDAESNVVLAEGLGMPASEAATQTFGVIGAKGSGKSYTARRLAEQLIRAGAPTVILDPIGNWWALRLAADGKSPGLAIPVIGGMHADLPLPADAGGKLAEALVTSSASAVIDYSEFSKSKRKEFVADFLEVVFRTLRIKLSPFHLIVEEAQLVAPQNCAPGEQRMLGAATDYVRLARNYGGGVTLLTQRPQSVSKEVLNQVECLFVGQLRGPHERKAIAEWSTDTGADDGVTNADLKALPSLAVGEFFCWSPSWLRVFKRVRILPTETFDASSTPTLGSMGRQRAPLAPVDLDALRALLAEPPPPESVDEDGAETSGDGNVGAAMDAAEAWIKRETDLLEEIQELRRRLRVAAEFARSNAQAFTQWADALDRGSEPSPPRPKLEDPCPIEGRDGKHEVYWTPAGDRLECIRCGARGNAADPIRPVSHGARTPEVPDEIDQISERLARYGEGKGMPVEIRGPRKAASRAKPIETASAGDAYQHELLAVIALHGPLDATLIGMLAGKSHRSSTFKAALRALRAAGLITGSPYTATAAGAKQAKPTPLPRGKALLEYWLARLPEYESLILGYMVAQPSHVGLSREEIAGGISRSNTSSSFKQAVRTLQKFGFVAETADGLLCVTDQFRKAVRA